MYKHTDSVRFLWKAVPLLVVGLCVAILGETIHQASAASPMQMASPAQNPRAGICHINNLATGANGTRHDFAVDAGAGWTRWPLYWNEIEPAGKGAFNWTAAEAVVNGDRAHGLQTNAILMNIPGPYDLKGSEKIVGLWEPIFADGSDETETLITGICCRMSKMLAMA